MKKIILASALIFLGLTISTAYVSASSVLQFSPASINTNPGKTFTVKVTLDPQGVKNYTAKMQVNFPADLLKVNSFTFGDSWMPVTVSGYDLIDNVNGILTKSAGYPTGTLNAVTFGTISFTSKKEGSGAISFNNGSSLVLNSSSQNVLSANLSPAQISIVPAPVVSKTPVATPETTGTPASTVTPEASITPTVTSTPTQTPTDNPKAIPASAAAASLSLLAGSQLFNWLAIILAIIIIIYVIWYFASKNKKDKTVKK